MLRNFAVASMAVVGLLTAAALPADAGANTGTWSIGLHTRRTLRLRTCSAASAVADHAKSDAKG